jgi:hypothetical protein
MVADVDFGLSLVGDDPSLTFIFFIGMAMLAVIGVRFGLYAYWNYRATDLPGQRTIWEFLAYVGVLATAYGLLGLVEIVTPLTIHAKQGVIVGFLLVLAVAFRQIYRTSTRASGAENAHLVPNYRAIEVGFAIAVVVLVVGMTLFGDQQFLIALEGVTAIAVAGYGLWYSRQQTAKSRVRGTMIDTLLRHLVAVLLFAALVPIIDLAVLVDFSPVVVLHVRVVLLIVAATALMTATIKLRQNLASL